MQVFPLGGNDAKGPLGAAGWKGEVWIAPGKPASVGAVHKEIKSSGEVAVVLGAGNQGVLAITDMLHMMFDQHCVCMVKHHELRSYNQPFFQTVFAPLISRGYLADVCGGVRVGVHLTNNPLVTRVHMTGGTATVRDPTTPTASPSVAPPLFSQNPVSEAVVGSTTA